MTAVNSYPYVFLLNDLVTVHFSDYKLKMFVFLIFITVKNSTITIYLETQTRLMSKKNWQSVDCSHHDKKTPFI